MGPADRRRTQGMCARTESLSSSPVRQGKQERASVTLHCPPKERRIQRGEDNDLKLGFCIQGSSHCFWHTYIHTSEASETAQRLPNTERNAEGATVNNQLISAKTHRELSNTARQSKKRCLLITHHDDNNNTDKITTTTTTRPSISSLLLNFLVSMPSPHTHPDT